MTETDYFSSTSHKLFN